MASRSLRMIELAKAKLISGANTTHCGKRSSDGSLVKGVNNSVNPREMSFSINPIPTVDDGNVNLEEPDLFEETFDDSDSDPTYQPGNKEDSSSEDDTSFIAKAAAEIEFNIVNYAEKHNTPAIPHNLAQSGISGEYQEAAMSLNQCVRLTKCKKKCGTKIAYEEQQILFNVFSKITTYEAKVAFVSGLIEIRDKKKQTLEKSNTSPRNRSHTYYYHLEVNGRRVEVCQKCFRFTLGVSESFIKTFAKKKLSKDGLLKDMRGRRNPVNKLTIEKITEIKDHINKYPAYESHYSRRDTAKKYLNSDLTLSKMYSMYCGDHQNPVSITKYCEIFRGMGLKFKRPKVDVCNKCEVFKHKIDLAKDEEEKTQHKTKQSEHHNEADAGYKSKDKDKGAAKQNQNMKLYTFDLQQCLPTPSLHTSVSFYKRQLWTFNLTIHNSTTNEAVCYMWHEAIGNRGGNDIASCIFQHLKSEPNHISHVVFYSDCCVGQNKNSFVATMMSIFGANSTNINIVDHKFLTPGHTHMECDVDHSVIERKKRKTLIKIHHPRDWYMFVRAAGNRNQFQVMEMTQNEFFNFSSLAKSKFMWRSSNQNAEKFNWQSVKWLRYTKEFGIVYYKCSLSEEEPFKSLNIRRRGINNINETDLPLSYESPLNISNAKKKDLLDQLSLIDPIYHDFYRNLNSANLPDIDPDIDELSESDEPNL